MQEIKISIAVGASRQAKKWTNKTLTWEEFTQRLQKPVRTTETLAEFLRASREDQGSIKDVGGYVGGYLIGGKRSPSSVGHRQLLTLDIDFATSDFWDSFTLIYGEAAVLHATHKHSPAEPRYRLLMPLDREATSEEYEAVARKVAGDLGIELFDNTTFEVNRLMYWPSHPRDVEYYYREQQGAALSVDTVLSTYIDWKDASLWPTADRKLREIGESVKKQEDPFMKRGVIGAFCRTYPIREAIATFLSEEYVEAIDGRYTYVKGTTSCGAVIYEDAFLYSHHGTDPASAKLCNAFDLVRLHKFGHLDDDGKSHKSFAAMENWVKDLPEVKQTLARERYEEARSSFEAVEVEVVEDSLEWTEGLEINTKGENLSTASNINLILQNDQFLKGAFKRNEFDGRPYIVKSMPWRRVDNPEPVRNVDYSGVRNYIECAYGISSQTKIDDALTLESERLKFHPVRDYLNACKWDGASRIDSLMIDYFGADDNVYTREAIRKMLVGAVARIFEPGVKFDYVMVFVGEQGLRKSSFLAALGREWFSDTFLGVHGKESMEQLQGSWIVEIGELAGLSKADVEAIKHFISKQRDQFRPAYSRVQETFYRQCVFFGTTNRAEFLRDATGNRRFLPVDVTREVTGEELDNLPVSQLWAEAVHLYRNGETLYLSAEAKKIAQIEQDSHREQDERLGLVQRYLDRLLPTNWESMDIYDRRDYLNSDNRGEEARRYVCIAEIWAECLGKGREEMSRYNTKDLNELMRSLPNWRARLSTKDFKLYGKQRYYEKIDELL
jgi:predicted P-loop ATPase